MKVRILTALACALIAAVVWIALRHSIGVATPLDPTAQAAGNSSSDAAALDRVEPRTDDSQSTHQVARVAATDNSFSSARETGIVLFGHVTDLPDSPADTRSGWIGLVDHLGTRSKAEFADDGDYSLSGLQPGRYWFSAGSRSGGAAKATIDLAFAENPKRFDVTLAAVPALLVKVADKEGQKVSSLLAVATLTPPSDWFTEVSGSMNNRFGVGSFHWNGDPATKLPEEYVGRLELVVPPPVFVSLVNYHRVIATQPVAKDQKVVSFVVDPASPLMKPGGVRVRFVRPDCTCITDIDAMLSGASGIRPMKREGEFLFVNSVAPGWYQIDSRGKGLDHSPVDVRVEPDAVTELAAVTREPELWIAGRLRSSEKLRGRLSIYCDPYHPESEPVFRAGRVETHEAEPDGTFRLGGLGRGLYVVKIGEREGSFGMCARIVDTRNGPVENVELEIVPGVPLVVRASNDDWSQVQFKVFDEKRAPVVSTRLWGPAPAKLMLAPGEYEVEVKTGSTEPVSKHVTLGSQPVELALP